MKVAFLLPHDFRFANVSTQEFVTSYFHFSKEYARRVAQRGNEVVLYTFGDDVTQTPSVTEVDGFTVKSFRPTFSFPPRLTFGNTHNLRLLNELKKDAPDIVHYHNYLLWGFPYVAISVKNHGTRLVAQFHGRVDPFMDVKNMLFYPAYRSVDRYLVPTREEASRLGRVARLNPEKIERFPSSGVDTELFQSVGAKTPVPSLLYVGRLPGPTSSRWEKSPKKLIWIMHALKRRGVEAHLSIVGTGPGMEHLKALSGSLGVSDMVIFHGPVGQSKLPALYSASWVSVLPMQMSDIDPYWGGALKESLACGTAVAAFNDGNSGFRRFGLLVPSTPDAAAEALGRAFRSPEQLMACGAGAPQFVRKNCDWEVLIGRLLSIYKVLTEENRISIL